VAWRRHERDGDRRDGWKVKSEGGRECVIMQGLTEPLHTIICGLEETEEGREVRMGK
jgi:hypothetical protein